MRPKNQGRREITNEQVERIISLHEQGYNRLRIQNETGISQPTIRKVLRDAGYDIQDKKPATRITRELKTRVIELRNAGLSYQIIAKQVGVSKPTVMNIVRNHAEQLEGRGEQVTPEEFIRAWQESESLAEVAIRLQMRVQSVASRAYNYRGRGVPLKRMKFASHYNWDDLKEFAELFLDEDDQH